MSIKPLFTAIASATGGRNGHTEAEDHSVAADLSVPKAMGGPGRPGRRRRNTCSPPAMPRVLSGAWEFRGIAKEAQRQGCRDYLSVTIGPRDAGGLV